MGDLKLDFDSIDTVQINMDDEITDTGIKLSQEDSSMLGVELLANPNSKADLSVTSDITGGYSSGGDDSVKSIKMAEVPVDDSKKEYDFFDKDKGGEGEVKKIQTPSVPLSTVPRPPPPLPGCT